MQITLNAQVASVVAEAAKFVISEGESVKSHGSGVYNCLKLSGLDSTVVVTAANGHAFYTARAAAIVPETGECVVPASTLRGALERFSNGTLEVEGNVVHVKEGRGKMNFTVDNSDTFPDFPKLETNTGKLTMKTEMFLRGLSVFYASMREDSRPILQSVRISVQENKLRFDAINGYLAARFETEIIQEITAESFTAAVIPAWVVKQLLGDRQMKTSDTISVIKANKAIVIKCGDVIILSHLLDGEFMDIENILHPNSLTLICDRAGITEILKKVELVTESAAYEKAKNPLIIDYDPDDGRLTLRISSSSSVFEDSLECEAIGDLNTVHMGLSPALLKQVIWQVDTDKVGLNIGGELTPMIVLPQYDKKVYSFTHLLVPTRIKKDEESEKNA